MALDDDPLFTLSITWQVLLVGVVVIVGLLHTVKVILETRDQVWGARLAALQREDDGEDDTDTAPRVESLALPSIHITTQGFKNMADLVWGSQGWERDPPASFVGFRNPIVRTTPDDLATFFPTSLDCQYVLLVTSEEAYDFDFPEDDNLVRVFSQNWAGDNPKVTLIPSGVPVPPSVNPQMSQRNLLKAKQEGHVKNAERRKTSQDPRILFPSEIKPWEEDPDFVSRASLDTEWQDIAASEFLAVPIPEDRIDSTNAWLASAFFTIPVFLKSEIEDSVLAMLKGFPYFVVESWEDVTAQKLKVWGYTVARNNQSFNMEHLKTSFWENLIYVFAGTA